VEARPTINIQARESNSRMNWKLAEKDNWKPEVVEILKNGYNPVVLEHQKSKFRNNKSSTMNESDTSECVKDLLSQGFISEITEAEAYDINPLTLVKKPGKNRLCIDTSRIVNKTIPSLGFKIRGNERRKETFEKGIWMGKIDLKNGYLHIPLHKDFKKYVCFRWKERVYQYNYLPFGINDAPRVFQDITNQICATLQCQRKEIIEAYLDDFWIQGQTEKKCQENITATADYLRKLGFRINYEKSQLKPVRKMEYLGMEFDSNLGLIKPTEKMIKGIKNQKPKLGWNTARDVRKFLGKLAFITVIDHRIKPFLMSTYRKIGNLGKDEDVELGAKQIKDLKLALELLPLTRTLKTNGTTTYEIWSDASKNGGGAVDEEGNTYFKPGYGVGNKSVEWETMNNLEVLHWKIQDGKKNLLIWTDNVSSRDIINKGSSKNRLINQHVCNLMEQAIRRGVDIAARYIPGIENTIADGLSRQMKGGPPFDVSKIVIFVSSRKKQDPPVVKDIISDTTAANLRSEIKTSKFTPVPLKPEELLEPSLKFWRKFHRNLEKAFHEKESQLGLPGEKPDPGDLISE